MPPDAESYPRPLTPTEQELVEWVLPADAAGYAPYRGFIAEASVIGRGRRGEGEIILGAPGDVPDLDAPLPPVVSFGSATADGDEVSVTVREIVDGQMSVEVVGRREDRVAPTARIELGWTYARWRPGSPCPQCGRPAREADVVPPDPAGRRIVLALCATDRRIWIHDGVTGVCRPVPVTNYYNELMIHKQVRDPAIALPGAKLFERLGDHSDADLAAAFVRYNRVRAKVGLPGAGPGGGGRPKGPLGRLMDAFRRNQVNNG
jgi:hypothetical protein